MRIHALIFTALFYSIQLSPASAGELVVTSEPVVRGSIRSNLSFGHECLSVPVTELRQGARLEMRPCQNSADQIFEWNVLSFEIKIYKLCVDALQSGQGNSQPGNPVGLWYCQGTHHQKWFPIRSSPHAPTLSFISGGNLNNDLCLTILDRGDTDGTQLAISNCDRGDNQQFRIQPWPALSSKVLSRSIGQPLYFPLP